jgi:assimilatory nitrate reductase catalytic subunit
VSEARIRSCVSTHAGTPSERLLRLQAELRCGTQCGSCLPELRRLVLESTAIGLPSQSASASAAA